jgi:hypothetical protein
MDNEPNNDSMSKLAWPVLIIGAILLVSAVTWKWFSSTAETAPVEAAVKAVAPQPAPVIANTTPHVTPQTGSACHILERDPAALTRQSEMLRKQAAGAAVSTAGPSRLALTEEQIKNNERKGLLLQ